MTDPAAAPRPPGRPRINPWSVWAVIIIAALGLVVGYNYMLAMKSRTDPSAGRPRFMGRLESDIELIERSGQKVRLGQLQGKVYIVSYVFTSCPRQCLGVLAEMNQVDKAFRGEKDLRFVTVSLDPANDTPERLRSWAASQDVDKPNWWFLTTDDPDKLATYMHREMLFMRVEKNTDPQVIATEGPFRHDARVALIDRGGHIRGFYPLLDPQSGDAAMAKLQRDLRYVLDEKPR